MQSANCKLKNDQRGHRRDRCHSAFCLLPSAFSRRAFTLVELLVTITILAILASLILAAMAGASSMAREAKTKGIVTKLHALVMGKYETYLTRRVPISMQVEPFTDSNSNGRHDGGEPYSDLNGNGQYDGRWELAGLRLNGLRELMRMEMPDRWTDVYDDPVTPIPRPAVSRAYQRALQRYIGAGTLPNLGANEPLHTHQGAECLYLIVSLGLDDPDVMEQFSASETGDADGDGFLEFHDGWGHPISFLRWAPGFDSPLQPTDEYRTSGTTGLSHDPFDPLKIALPTSPSLFTGPPSGSGAGLHPPLFPLVYSAGPDGILGIATENNPPSGPSTPFQYSTTTPKNNPYAAGVGSPANMIGTPDTTGESIDNITNHDIEAR